MKYHHTKCNHKTFIFTLILLNILLLVACGGSGASAESEPASAAAVNTLTISGSGSTMSVLEGLEKEFEAAAPNYRLELLPGTGSGGGVQGVVDEVLDVAALARDLNEEEKAQGLEFFSFGKAATAVFTHADVGVTALSKDQLVDIFTGKITNWSELGGPDEDIILFVRDEKDSSTGALRETIFGDAPFAESAQIITSASDMLNIVAGTVNSIGFGTRPAARAQNAPVTAVALDGVAPNDPSYPITNEMGLGYLPAHKTDVQPLIDWLSSEDGQAKLIDFDMILTP